MVYTQNAANLFDSLQNEEKKIFTEYTKCDYKTIQLSCKADRDQTIAL